MPEQETKCKCDEIMAKDPTRHFRGCPKREEYPTHAAEGAPFEFTLGDTTIRELAVQLPRQGRLSVAVSTGDQTLHKDETTLIAKELREIADVYEKLSTPEDNS